MNERPQKRPQTPAEELANSISHGIGFLAALIGTPFLLASASRHSSGAVLVGSSIFCGAMLLLYLASTLYHAMPHGSEAKKFWAVLDHTAIFLLIAGTYTPFTLGVLQGGWGWSLFGIVWSLAALGIFLKLKQGTAWKNILSTCLYLCMGWLIVFAIRPLNQHVPHLGIMLLVAGGLSYTLGVPFYLIKNKPFFHFIWHLFVLAGTSFHFFAVLWYAA